MVVQTKKNEQQTRRQSRVHFQTPEANVVSEAADPDQDERNNSSKAGSTPFQAKLQRRVSFAAQDDTVEQENAFSAAEQASAASLEAGHSFALAARCLDDCTAASTPSVIKAFNAETSIDQGIASADAAVADKNVFSEAVDEESADETDDSYSDGTVSVAAGSTPYLNRRMLSAALQASTPDDGPLDEDFEEGADNKAGAKLSSMMARLLSEEWDSSDEQVDEFAEHDQVSNLYATRTSTCASSA